MDMRDFVCDACWTLLPHFPSHGERGTYCSEYCRTWAEGQVIETEEED